jgi:hypothetical protein
MNCAYALAPVCFDRCGGMKEMDESRLRTLENEALNALTAYLGKCGKSENTAAHMAAAFLALLNDHRAVLRCVDSAEGQNGDA